MFTEERQNAIEKCLREKGKVRVKELSEMFQVTEDCIRKDLKILENAGRLKRTYGGAILSQEYPLERNVVDRRMYNLDKKKVIAAKAFKLIKNNETIFLDVSTTNIELASLFRKKASGSPRWLSFCPFLDKRPGIFAAVQSGWFQVFLFSGLSIFRKKRANRCAILYNNTCE